MKEILIYTAALLISFNASAQNHYTSTKTQINKTDTTSTTVLAPEVELQIKNIIEDEAYNFYTANFREWEKGWLQDDSSCMGSMATDELKTEIKGWKLIKAVYQHTQSHLNVVGFNFYEHKYIKLSDSVIEAESSFRIITMDPGGPYIRQRLILKKINSEWKIVALYNSNNDALPY